MYRHPLQAKQSISVTRVAHAIRRAKEPSSNLLSHVALQSPIEQAEVTRSQASPYSLLPYQTTPGCHSIHKPKPLKDCIKICVPPDEQEGTSELPGQLHSAP